MTDKPTVYIIQKPNSTLIDVSSAEEYGEVKYIFESRYQASQNPQEAINILREKLSHFKPGDFVASAAGGDFGAIFMAGMILPEILADETGLVETPIKWLRWERKRDVNGQRLSSGFYIPSTIKLDE